MDEMINEVELKVMAMTNDQRKDVIIKMKMNERAKARNRAIKLLQLAAADLGESGDHSEADKIRKITAAIFGKE